MKSGKNYYEHSALSKVVDNPEYDVREAYVFTNYQPSVSGKIKNYPVYLVTFLRDDTELPVLKKIEQ